MARTRDGYSRLVLMLKLVLPLAGLAILSTLFLLARSFEAESSIPYAKVDVEEVARQQLLSSAQFSAVTASNAALLIEAERARPDPEMAGLFFAEVVDSVITLEDGQVMTVRSDAARIDTDKNIANLSGDVKVLRDDGLSLVSEEIDTNLDKSTMTSDVPVEIMGDFGLLTADTMRVKQRAGPGGRLIANFVGNVKLLYEPAE
ncbi:MAG: LPS export ABC transporter periplasmic protein LptC [Pseudomonadota bacterium]